jgi:beta,beta-carotene 9',10'-dioxygenase
MHSFAITEHYVVLVEFPLTVNPISLVLSGKPFIDNYRWNPEAGTRFIVMDLRNGRVRGVFRGDAFFAFHHINAYEEGDEIVLDMCSYADAQVIDDLRLDALRREDPVSPSYPTRYRVDLASGTVGSQRLADEPLELPRISYGSHNGRQYRFVYGIGSGPSGNGFADQLVKLDTETGKTLIWSEPGCFPGEPVFVGEPGGEGGEDHGVVLSVVLDSVKGNSKLVVLDTETFHEVASAEVPQVVPLGFHGMFSRDRG